MEQKLIIYLEQKSPSPIKGQTKILSFYKESQVRLGNKLPKDTKACSQGIALILFEALFKTCH